MNQNEIRSNTKNKTFNPVITIKSFFRGRVTPLRNDYGHSAVIKDKDGVVVAEIKYQPDDPLSCGARVWIETECEVVLRHGDKEVTL